MKVLKAGFSYTDEEGVENVPVKIEEAAKEISLNEKGVRPILEFCNIDSQKSIYESVKKLNEKAVMLGGSHSVTAPAVKAFAEKSRNPGIIIFDAHPDCLKKTGEEDLLRFLVNNHVIKPENIILAGVRSISGDEKEFLELHKIRLFDMRKIFDMGAEEACDIIMENASSFDALYVSIDIDCVDPAFAPGTGCAEPGGLSSREIIYFVQRISMMRNFKMADIVEVDSDKDVNNMTVKLAARILGEMC